MAAVPPPKLTHAQANAVLNAPGQPFELEEVVVRGQKLRQFKNAQPDLASLWRTSVSLAKPDSEYLVFYDENGQRADSYTWRQSVDIVASLSNYLVTELGVKKGDRIGIAMRNWPEWVLMFWARWVKINSLPLACFPLIVAHSASVSIGAIVTPLNGWFTGPELAYCLSNSGTSVLLADGDRYERLLPELRELQKGGLQHIIVARTGGKSWANTITWEFAVAKGGQIGKTIPKVGPCGGQRRTNRNTIPTTPKVDIEPDDSATIFYTSGTTGKPKGAEGTHRNWTQLIMVSGFQVARQFVRQGEPVPQPDPNAIQRAILISVPLFVGCFR